MMKRKYQAPKARKIDYCYNEQVVAASRCKIKTDYVSEVTPDYKPCDAYLNDNPNPYRALPNCMTIDNEQ